MPELRKQILKSHKSRTVKLKVTTYIDSKLKSFPFFWKIIINIGDQYRNGIFLPKLLWPTLKKKCFSDGKKLLKFEAEDQEFAKYLRSLEKMIQTLTGKNHSW